MKTEITLLILDAGSDTVREATGDEILEAARAYLTKRIRRGTTLSSPKATRDYPPKIGHLPERRPIDATSGLKIEILESRSLGELGPAQALTQPARLAFDRNRLPNAPC